MKNFKLLKSFSKIAAPVFTALSYLGIGVAALLCVVCLIVPIVNVPTNEMLLPPFMSMDSVNGLYEISLGNGILIRRAAADVTLGNIKTAIYCGIAVAVVVLLVLAPIFYLLGKLLKNVAEENLFAAENAGRIKRIGLLILVGNTLTLFVERFFNYYLVHTFLASGEQVVFRAGLDFVGIVMGLFVILVGNIYGYATEMHTSALDAAGQSDMRDRLFPLSENGETEHSTADNDENEDETEEKQ